MTTPETESNLPPIDDDALSRQLDAIGSADRAEPDADFENRVADALERASMLSRHRHVRKKKSTAWIPFAAAAFVGVFAWMWMPSEPMRLASDDDAPTVLADASPEELLETEALIASFDAMDAMIAATEEIDAEWLDLRLDAAEHEFASPTEWQDIGGAL